jgi:hypothetical protein
MPIIVLVVGGTIALWASRRETLRMNSVHSQVQAICRRVGDGADVAGLLNKANPTVEAVTLARLRDVIDSPEAADAVAIRVTPGDLPGAGTNMMPATHTAMLVIGDVERLALRVHCDDPDKPITVVGFVEPAPR